MTLEQQVTSFEISQHLEKLGVKQESLWYWQKSDVFQRWIVCPYADDGFKNFQSISAFTVAELGEMLPRPCDYNKVPGAWVIRYETLDHVWEEMADTEADARGKMLIYLLENKIM